MISQQKRRPPGPAREAAAKASAQTIATRVEELERNLERVRASFEAYFLGLERRAPELARQQLHHRLLEMQTVSIVNTALRFRYHNLMQRFTQLAGHWNRTMREIEAGTYRRDVLKAARRMAGSDGSRDE